MKQLIISIYLLSSLAAVAQKKDSIASGYLSGGIILGIGIGNDAKNQITLFSDGRVEIEGDTLQAIRNIFKWVDDHQKEDAELYRENDKLNAFVAATVAFLNQNPTVITANNCNWPRLSKELKRQGYHTVKLKQPKVVCHPF